MSDILYISSEEAEKHKLIVSKPSLTTLSSTIEDINKDIKGNAMSIKRLERVVKASNWKGRCICGTKKR